MPSRRPLPVSFYRREPAVVARDLLGCRLTRRLPDGSTRSVILVETEAYLGVKDRAAHTWNGRRTATSSPCGEKAATRTCTSSTECTSA